MGSSPNFSAMFLKGDNFRDLLFAYLEDEIIPKWDLHLTLRAPSKIAADGTFIFFTFICRRKEGLMFPVNPLPSRKIMKKIFKTVVCCSRD